MNYNNPFIKMLETIANMLIVTLLWFAFSLPLVTVIASSAALYHTTNKVIFGPKRGNGVFNDFFRILGNCFHLGQGSVEYLPNRQAQPHITNSKTYRSACFRS